MVLKIAFRKKTRGSFLSTKGVKLMKERKDYQRTIRMTQTTRKYLEETEGNGLNEKFENLVYAAYLREQELQEKNHYLKAENERLQQEIEGKRQLLQEKVAQMETYINQIFNV